jgi:hypothetical protein
MGQNRILLLLDNTNAHLMTHSEKQKLKFDRADGKNIAWLRWFSFEWTIHTSMVYKTIRDLTELDKCSASAACPTRNLPFQYHCTEKNKHNGLFGCRGFLKQKYYKTMASNASVKKNHDLEKKEVVNGVLKTLKWLQF